MPEIGAPTGVTDHDDLTGVSIDDHHARDHKARHADGGADEIAAGDLKAGADPRSSTHATRHASGGADEISLAGLTPPAHKTTHESGGSDVVDADTVDTKHAADLVQMTGAQTIAGVKTFSSIPVLPASDPTADNEAARKAYVDSVAASPGEGHITILPLAYNSIEAGSWALALDANNWLLGYLYNSTHADADEIRFKVYMAAGTYTLQILVKKGDSYGIVDIYIDTDEVASFDLYASPVTHNNRLTQADITVAASGLKTIRWVCDGKNASSSNHYIPLQYMTFWRTA